jgi:hypothetical protein
METVKITRMRTLYKKLREGCVKLKADNAKELGTETGMMGPGGGKENMVVNNKRQRQVKADLQTLRIRYSLEWSSKNCQNKKYKVRNRKTKLH